MEGNEQKKKRIQVTGRWGRRSKQLLNDLKEKIGYCKLKEEALEDSMITGCGRGHGSVVPLWHEWIRGGRNERKNEWTNKWRKECEHVCARACAL